jgi:hypothetical protein
MKKTFIIYIMACITSLFIFSSCEENTDQVMKSQPDTTKEITNRSIDDCEDCPQDPEHCCCVVENLTPNNIDLVLCGVYTMTIGSACGPVSPGSPCGTISGISYIIQLGPNGRELFCAPNGGSFSIVKTGIGGAAIRISCKAEQGIIPWINFTIDNNPWYFYVEDCDLKQC